jgi:molybdopterin-guanine dinucleotide biosynthesis protein MobB
VAKNREPACALASPRNGGWPAPAGTATFAGMEQQGSVPPVICIVGRKNSGKTTLLVGIAAELKRRGVRVATVKHSHHDVELDHAGKDSWRHYHEGGAEAVILATPVQVGVLMRADGEGDDPELLARRFLSGRGYDVVLAESFRRSRHPRIEIFRRSVHPDPLLGSPETAGAGPYLGIITDAPALPDVHCPVVPLQADGGHVRAAADLVMHALGQR